MLMLMKLKPVADFLNSFSASDRDQPESDS